MSDENKKLVLVVDDEENTRRFLEVALTNIGYNVIKAENGADALNYLNDNKPDAIVLDIVMPDMDGYSFIKNIKKIPELQPIPLIVSSGKGGMKEYFDLEEEIYRPQAFLIKPYELKLLTKTVKEIVG